ncbi:serine--tRNA ligase [Zavarzinia compransoris]|uniref:serine--tRNA ligase n=1 Tax=Zavarzinia marina TaxID=2911065 RepID=UPI001EEF7089|nr:serine--tRNA ligase [Zavarzinia marina]MCF4164432.1 serine--tRNA ligase [Zavarzinia marina]
MHDLKLIRDDPAAFDAALARRGFPASAAGVLDLDQQRRAIQSDLQVKQARRNDASRQIGQVKGKGGNADDLMAEVAGLKAEIQAGEEKDKALAAEIEAALAAIPNLPGADVPEGGEDCNVEIRRWGTPRLMEGAAHFEIGEALGLMDFEAASRISGARFVVLKGQLARLERALGQFMLDLHTTENGYTEVAPPLLVRDDAVYGTGQLPKFAEDLFRTTNGYWLIPTAEVPLTNLVREQILDAEKLPLRFTALTPCFRSEAGAAGRDTRGMIRQHQFAKCEMVSVTTPEQSAAEHERMTACAEDVLKRLDLPYRVMLLAAGDMGFGAVKTYDLEVWLPGQKTYREISSCSNCGDFQARRMQARSRTAGAKGTAPVHTLNGSGLAVGRTLVAVLENYARPDGSVEVPAALRPYMGGLEAIAADG